MRKHSWKPAAPGLRADGYPNRALKRSNRDLSIKATIHATAARLIPGFVWRVK